jgi:hypothetical protein
MAAKPLSPEKNIAIIRIAIAMGAVLFALVSLYTRSREPMVGDPDVLNALRYATIGLSAAAIGVALIVRSACVGKPLPQQYSYTIGGWAAGEAAALVACVQHFQGGTIPVMTIGFLAFAAVFVLLPIPTGVRQ